MSVPVRLTDLRAALGAHPEAFAISLPGGALLALVDAVEAAHVVYEAEEYGIYPLGDEVSAWLTLGNALSRFDHSGADGQPTTTKGGNQ